jgi:hypothetical protein
MRPYHHRISLLLIIALLLTTLATAGTHAARPGPQRVPAKAAENSPHAALSKTSNGPAAPNAIDDPEFFVRQHYLDFLNREPDPAGLDFWTKEITNCGADQVCRERKRISVSTAFFLSIEYQNSGYLVYRFYKASFIESAGRPRGLPRIDELVADSQQVQHGLIVGQPNWELQLKQNKQDFARLWVQRAEFLTQFPSDMAAGAFVDKLFANSEVTPTQAERDAAVAAFGAGGVEGRAAALLNVTDSRSVYNKQYNSAFVLMQYFGYLRRNSNDAPDANFAGFDFWLAKLDSFSVPGQDVRDEAVALERVSRAEMVKAFLVSDEYRSRFGLEAVTFTPGAALPGKTVTVNISGQFTSFIKNVTRARFGDGISVGGAAAGDFGPVNVIDRTHATAEVTVAGTAVQGLRSVTFQTVAESLVQDGRFSVAAVSPLAISADVDRTTGVLGTNFTFTGRVVDSTSPVDQWHWKLSDGRELTGVSVSASFPTPGLYSAQVTATDQEGHVVQADTGVMVFDPTTQGPPELGLPTQIGDIDGDGLITLKDAHKVSKHAGRLELLPADKESAADVDLDGQVTQADALLLGQAVAAGAPLPSALLPAHGAPGVRVTLISPALLDPTAKIEIAVGESLWIQQPLRTIRGYATFMIPFDATHSGSMQVTPGPVEVRVTSNGAVANTLTFQVEAPPALPADPKAELKNLLDDYTALLVVNQDEIRGLLDDAHVDGSERELLLAAFTTAHEDVTVKLAKMRALLDVADGDKLARLLFLYANANGYPEFRHQLTELLHNETSAREPVLKGLTANTPAASAEDILVRLCRVKRVAHVLSTGGDILSFTCDALLIAAVIAAAVPAAGELVDAALLFTWASTCATVEGTVELALMLNEFVDKMDADLRFEASPTAPQAGQSVKLRATVEIVGTDDLCTFGVGKARDALIAELGRRAAIRLLRRKLALRAISSAIGLLAPRLIIELERRLGEALGRVVDNTGVGDALEEFTSHVCDFVHSGVPITYELNEMKLHGPNPNVGTRTFPGDGTADYMCPAQGSSAENVTFNVSLQLCDETQVKTVTVSCQSHPVTITMGDNGNLLDDIFEVKVDGQTVLTSSAPVRSISTTLTLPAGNHGVQMIGRAAPDGVGTYFIQFSGATVVSGDPLSGTDLTPGVVKNFTIRVQ